jgi:hypothetical protein
VLDSQEVFGQQEPDALTRSAHVPLFGHVHILFDPDSELGIVYLSAEDARKLDKAYIRLHTRPWRDLCWQLDGPIDTPHCPTA